MHDFKVGDKVTFNTGVMEDIPKWREGVVVWVHKSPSREAIQIQEINRTYWTVSPEYVKKTQTSPTE